MQGGFGIVGSARLTPNQLLNTILKIKKLTTHPYGVNLQLAPPDVMKTDENVAAAVQQFLDTNFRQNNGLKPRSGQSVTLPHSRLSEQLQIIRALQWVIQKNLSSKSILQEPKSEEHTS